MVVLSLLSTSNGSSILDVVGVGVGTVFVMETRPDESASCLGCWSGTSFSGVSLTSSSRSSNTNLVRLLLLLLLLVLVLLSGTMSLTAVVVVDVVVSAVDGIDDDVIVSSSVDSLVSFSDSDASIPSKKIGFPRSISTLKMVSSDVASSFLAGNKPPVLGLILFECCVVGLDCEKDRECDFNRDDRSAGVKTPAYDLERLEVDFLIATGDELPLDLLVEDFLVVWYSMPMVGIPVAEVVVV